MEAALISLVIDNLAFLELSGPAVIDPDAAVRQMETTAATLQMLTRSQGEVHGFRRQNGRDGIRSRSTPIS